MIKILEYGEVRKDDIFARCEDIVNVSDTVTEIINNVKYIMIRVEGEVEVNGVKINLDN